MYMRDMLAETMKENLGIVRSSASLQKGLEDVDHYLSVADRINYDASVSAYSNYSLMGILTLARAVLTCADFRKESRGAHYREDHPDTLDEYAYATLISYDNSSFHVDLDRDKAYEN